MPIHDEVLATAIRLCRDSGGWVFRPADVVVALPHLNPRSVRTHIVSRCCVNAPKHHAHKWDYFRRVGRGLYEVRAPYRRRPAIRGGPSVRGPAPAAKAVGERAAAYVTERKRPPGGTVHAVVELDGGIYVARCLEIAAVTQGRSLEEVVSNLREAVELYVEGEDLPGLGLAAPIRLSVTFEVPVPPHAGTS